MGWRSPCRCQETGRKQLFFKMFFFRKIVSDVDEKNSPLRCFVALCQCTLSSDSPFFLESFFPREGRRKKNFFFQVQCRKTKLNLYIKQGSFPSLGVQHLLQKCELWQPFFSTFVIYFVPLPVIIICANK
jgi:hypothetical protein